MSPNRTGRSPPMPTVKLDLGSYVVLKPRKDGTARVLFQVPARLRPSDWRPAIPLPFNGRTGKLDAGEVARIVADAKALRDDLERRRKGQPTETARSLETLVNAWLGASQGLRPTTLATYACYARNILAWTTAGDPTTLTQSDIEGFLTLFTDRPTTKRQTLRALSMVMDQAVGMGWRTDNPCDRIRTKVPTSRSDVWEQTDVDAYVEAAHRLGRPSVALMILLGWEIGQRLTDVRGFRKGAEYRAGVFRFEQSKTGAEVVIPVSATLRALLDEGNDLFLFRDEGTGKAYTADRLVYVFDLVRQEAVSRGARPLKLKWLRHSCVVQLARAECTVPQIAAVTGHTLASAHKILAAYLPRDSEVARSAQEKRGLV